PEPHGRRVRIAQILSHRDFKVWVVRDLCNLRWPCRVINMPLLHLTDVLSVVSSDDGGFKGALHLTLVLLFRLDSSHGVQLGLRKNSRLRSFQFKEVPIFRVLLGQLSNFVEVILTARRTDKDSPAVTVRQSGEDDLAPQRRSAVAVLVKNNS